MAEFNIPGVYSKIDASAAVGSLTANDKVIGIIAKGIADDSEHNLTNKAYAPFSFKDAQEKYGDKSEIVKLMDICLKNGGSRFIVVRVGQDEAQQDDYKNALAVAELEEAIDIIIVDTDDKLILSDVKEHCKLASDNRKERITVVGFEAGANIATSITAAKELNSGLVYMQYPNPLDINGVELSGIYAAAALAGQIAAETDPSMPMTNVGLNGFYGLSTKLKDDEMNSLIEAGIIPLEVRAGQIRVVRAISTYTVGESGEKDITWQELTTVLTTHYIFKDLRKRLANGFSRAKQSQATRDAIKSEVLSALLQYEGQEMIENVDEATISIAVNPFDPFRNDVDFEYNVTGPVNVIFLTGHLVI